MEPWDVKVFQRHRDDDPTETCPAEEFLDSCPDAVAADLIAIIDAVATAPPPQFTGGGMWEAMHGGMRGFDEARTRGPDRRLYRHRTTPVDDAHLQHGAPCYALPPLCKNLPVKAPVLIASGKLRRNPRHATGRRGIPAGQGL